MTAEQFFDKNDIDSCKTPKRDRRFTYFDLIKFAEMYKKDEMEYILSMFEAKIARRTGYQNNMSMWERRTMINQIIEKEI